METRPKLMELFQIARIKSKTEGELFRWRDPRPLLAGFPFNPCGLSSSVSPPDSLAA